MIAATTRRPTTLVGSGCAIGFAIGPFYPIS